MLVICEECSKKYNVDRTQIRGEKARFTCQKCGHSIIVRKDGLPVAGQVKTGEALGTELPR